MPRGLLTHEKGPPHGEPHRPLGLAVAVVLVLDGRCRPVVVELVADLQALSATLPVAVDVAQVACHVE